MSSFDGLPLSPRAHDIGRAAIAIFEASVPQSLFLVRYDLPDDYGNDRILEAKVGSRITNFRCHVQVKGTTNSRRHADGSVRFQLKRSTITYLLNQPHSIVVLVLLPTKTILFSPAHALAQDAMGRGIDLGTDPDKEITFRFRRLLDSDEYHTLHTNILRTGNTASTLSSILQHASAGDVIPVAIDTLDGTVHTREEAVALIKRHGLWLVNTGQLSVLERIAVQLKPSPFGDPELGAVMSYAAFHAGRYYDAHSWLPKGLDANTLSSEHYMMVRCLEAILAYVNGGQSLGQLWTNLHSVERDAPGTLLGKQLRLARLRSAIGTVEPMRREDFTVSITEYLDAARDIESALPRGSIEWLKVHLEICEVITYRVVQQHVQETTIVIARESMGAPIPKPRRIEMARSFVEDVRALISDYQALSQTEWPTKYADALVVVGYARTQVLLVGNLEAFSAITSVDTANVAPSRELIFRNTIERLDDAIAELQQAQMWQDSLKARLVRAECLSGLENHLEARSEIEAVIQDAKRLGSASVEAAAERLLNEGSIFDLHHRLASRNSVDDLLLALTDAQLPAYVRGMAAIWGLPEDSFPLLEKSILWHKEDAQERRTWCRYLQVKDVGDTLDQEVAFDKEGVRTYTCLLLGYASPWGQTEREPLLQQFKARYCLGCSERIPASAQ